MRSIQRNPTRALRIGSITIGDNNPIAVQSMTATHTQDINATVVQIKKLQEAGADIVRVAVDNKKDAEALAQIRQQTTANLVVDLQENYKLAAIVAPHVDKIRYNPGHLFHTEITKPWQDKVKFIVDVAVKNGCALRVGVNCGSVDQTRVKKYEVQDLISPMLESALEHCELLDRIGFSDYCVSLKDSDFKKVIEVNRRFATQRPEIPLHLGVTEAGLPPSGVIKTRIAFEQLLGYGIGDTVRVSLTVPNSRKVEEVYAGKQILEDIANGKVRSVVDYRSNKLNIIACPSCSRVENESFVELATRVEEETKYAKEHRITIAVMGCRVNGPGETDAADLGLWCGPHYVNLKRGSKELGAFAYDRILPRLHEELSTIIAERTEGKN